MNFFRTFLSALIMQQVIFQLSSQLSFRPKHYKIERAASCPIKTMHGGKLEKFELTQPNKYHFHIDADVRFLKNVSDTIQFQLKYTKCALDNNLGATCDNHEIWKIDNVCDRLVEKNAIWSPLLKIIKPKLVCPIKKGLYSIRNGTLDLTMVSRLPIDGIVTTRNEANNFLHFFEGFRYKTTISFYELAKDTKPLELMCFHSDVIITLSTSGRPRHKTRL